MPKNKEEYYSESLFQDADLPCRIVVCFVETAHKNGTASSNPFAFYRSWKIETDSQLVSFRDTDCENKLEKLVDEKFLKLERQFSNFLAVLGQSKVKGKGRGKKSKPCQPEPQPSTSQEAAARLEGFVDACTSPPNPSSSYADSDVFTEDLPSANFIKLFNKN